MSTFHRILGCSLLLLFGATPARSQDWLNLGFLYDHFDLTLTEGERTEALGPFFYHQQQDTATLWAVPPLLSYAKDPSVESRQFNFLYPLMSYSQIGGQYRWNLVQLISFAGGETQTEDTRKRFTIFPIYFQQTSSDPAENYIAAGPFYGHLRNRLMRDEIFYVMFPAYSRTRKRDVETHNILFPIFHLRNGEGLDGWQVWPLFGREHKDVTTRTNSFGDPETVPGHDKTFALWPVFHNQRTGIGSENPQWQQAVLPLYFLTRSTNRDATTILWPFFSKIEEREKQYTEWHAPWPFVVFASGEGKTVSRVWPFFSHGRSTNLQSDVYMWPVYRYNRLHTPSIDRERRRVLLFLFSDINEANLETAKSRRRMDFWPLFTYRRDFNGARRLQVLAPIEPLIPGNKKIEHEYSQVWSLYRSEKNDQGASSQSLLWNLYRRDSRPDKKQISFLFGLFQQRKVPGLRETRVLFIPFRKRVATDDKFDPLPEAHP